MLSRILRWVPFVLACAAIAVVSQMGQPPLVDLASFWQLDKLLHALAYAIVGALALVAVGFDALARSPARAVIGAWVLTVAYGVSDELHQCFVPGRSASAADVIADAVGAAVGIALLTLALRRRAARARPAAGAARESLSPE